MDNTFDMKRFWKLAVCHLADTWKELMRTTLRIGFGFTILYCFTVWESRRATAELIEDTNHIMVGYTTLAFCFLMLVAAASIFANMKTKQQRINFMMLPASNLEKYLIRLLTVTIGYFLCFTIGIAMADILQIIFRTAATGKISFHPVIWTAIKMFCEFINEIFNYTPPEGANMLERNPTLILLTIAVGYMHIHSVYTLGGALFRKQAWLLTTGVMLAISLLTTIFAGDLFIDIIELPASLGRGIPAYVLAFNLSAASTVTTLFYWVSYKLFTRTQVIDNRWINI